MERVGIKRGKMGLGRIGRQREKKGNEKGKKEMIEAGHDRKKEDVTEEKKKELDVRRKGRRSEGEGDGDRG